MTDQDRDILFVAITAYAEARSEGRDGIRWQVHSVVNRHATGRWYAGKTLAGTCVLGYAYSAWNTTDRNHVIACETPVDDPVLAICLEEATAAVTGTTDDPTSAATHYYVSGSPVPDWVSGINSKNGAVAAPPAVFCGQQGKHLFYRGVQ